MAVNYDQATQNARLNSTLTRIDNHASPATLEIATAGYASVLAILTLNDPSFVRGGATPNTALTMQGVPKSNTAAATGAAAVARIKDGGGTVIVNNLTVGVGTGDIQLNATSITTGQTVTITAGTITHAA